MTTRSSLSDPRPSVRLRAAMQAGAAADPDVLDELLEQMAVEPDFFVRDMLTWALAQLPKDVVVPRLVALVAHDPRTRARSQALHTLSKTGDPRGWDAITPALIAAPDDELAQSAWRAAVVLVPPSRRAWLVARLVEMLGRGDDDLRLSLSRALVALDDDALDAVRAAGSADGASEEVRAHAARTLELAADPSTGHERALHHARRLDALGPAAPG